MRTPANGHAVSGRSPDGYDGAQEGYRTGGPQQNGTPDGGDPYRGRRAANPAADRFVAGEYPPGSYSTARYTGTGYESVASATNRTPDREIASQGYSPAGDNVPTQLFRPTRESVHDWGGGPSDVLDLDEPRRRTPPPPPLRNPAQVQPAVQQRAGWSALGAPASAAPPPAPKGPRLRVDWPNCKAHGLCHELLPEAIRLDEWGFPMVGKQALPDHVIDDARRAVIACPTLALRLID